MKTEEKDFREMSHDEWCESVQKRFEELSMRDSRKSWKWLVSRLPYLNEAAIEKKCRLRKGRLYDAKAGRSKMTDEELKTTNRELKRMFGDSISL